MKNPHPPPAHTAPTQFLIGTCQTDSPLVNVPEIKRHLALLRLFAELKNEVTELGPYESAPYIPTDKEKRWSWFVALAVERFDIWCRSLRFEDARRGYEELMPPLDVIMVWHAYMLNPRWYAEDCLRVPTCAVLKDLGPHFDEALLQFSGVLSDHHHPSQPQMKFWRERTSLPFDPLECARTKTKKMISCPQCRTRVQVDLMDANGQGYLQENFSAPCTSPSCSIDAITKEKLAVRKLAEDLVASTGNAAYLPGTLYEPKSPSDANIGKRIKRQVCGDKKSVTSATDCNRIIKSAKFSLGTMRSKMVLDVKSMDRLMKKIMEAYNDDKVYSVESSAKDRSYELGWTQSGFFDSPADELALQHALARYHAFLDLLESSSASFYIPTLDIDLVWRTHQLTTMKYASDCKRYVGRYIDHDDKIEGLRLTSIFDLTCRAWKERFKVQYTHCGCPVLGDSIGERLEELIKLYSPPPHSHLLASDRPDFLSATHPNEHNAGHFIPRTQQAHTPNPARYALKALKKVVLKSPKKITKITPQSLAGSTPSPNPFSQRPTTYIPHPTPFLVPVPAYYPGVMISADCVANSQALQPAAGCASRNRTP